MLIAPLITAVLEQSLNHLLFNLNNQDAAIKSARYRLQGKCLSLTLKELSIPLVLVFSHAHVDVLSRWDSEIHCTVKTQLWVFKKLHEREQITSLIRSGELEVEGDITVLQQLLALLELLEWDPAEWLAPYIGDVAAYSISNNVQHSLSFIQNLLQKKQRYLSEAMVEEWRLAPGALEFTHFCDSIDELQRQFGRLANRMENLETK